jgi:hypothetical protein
MNAELTELKAERVADDKKNEASEPEVKLKRFIAKKMAVAHWELSSSKWI